MAWRPSTGKSIQLPDAIFSTHLVQNTPDAVYIGIGQGFLVAAGVAVLGIISSAVKDEAK